MSIKCKLGDIRTNNDIWKLTGVVPEDTVCLELEPGDYISAYKLDKYYDIPRCPEDKAIFMKHELHAFYKGGRVFEYDFRIIVPALNGFFRIGCDRKDFREEPFFPSNRIHFYSDSSAKPDVLSRGELFDTACYFLNEGNSGCDPDDTECIIETPNTDFPEVRCTLGDLESMINSVTHPIREYSEVYNTSFDFNYYSGRYMYDYEVYIPELGLVLQEGIKVDMEEDAYEEKLEEENEEHLDIIQSGIYHCYIRDYVTCSWDENDEMCSNWDRIYSHVEWYVEDKEIDVPDIDALECIITLPYRRKNKELITDRKVTPPLNILNIHDFGEGPENEAYKVLLRLTESEWRGYSLHTKELKSSVISPELQYGHFPVDFLTYEEYLKANEISLVVGTGLGGFYAAVICAKYGIPAIVINPCLTPFLDLPKKGYTGSLSSFMTYYNDLAALEFNRDNISCLIISDDKYHGIPEFTKALMKNDRLRKTSHEELHLDDYLCDEVTYLTLELPKKKAREKKRQKKYAERSEALLEMINLYEGRALADK